MSNPSRPPVSWEAEKSHPELMEPLIEALRSVIDPEIGLNVIELGLIRNVIISEDQANLTMIMTTPFCPYAPAILETTRQKAQQALSRHIIMSLGMEPWDPSMMEEGAGAAWGFF